MLRVLIADDEPLARDRLRDLLQAEPGIEIVGECATGTETVKAIQNESPHLVLLDVRMPELDGFEVIRALGVDRLPTIIFVMAHDEFALRAFEAHAADYHLKWSAISTIAITERCLTRRTSVWSPDRTK